MTFSSDSRKPGAITRFLVLWAVFYLIAVPAFPQTEDSLIQPGARTVIAGGQYNKSSFHQFLWGKHYRKDWATPVRVSTINLDTVNGGLTAYEKGGGRQSKTLRLRNTAGKEYVLRSIDKSFGKALPDKYRGTFIERIIDDQVSIAQPYAAVTIPGMAEAASVYHTNPQVVFVPSQKALGEFNKDFGDDLYLFEQRPDENWEEASNFGNAKKIVGTEKMLENIFKDNDNRVDQLGFVRARLFDMFIGDWGRHEDQWRWATIEDGEKKWYKPIPRDRDQAYTKFDGALLSVAISAAGAGHLESFGSDIKNVATYNFPARNLDRQAANEPSREQWIGIAKELQESLTNKVIEESVRQLPPEVFSLSGMEIIQKLKSRRDKLVEFAGEYYAFLAREVDVVGTHDAEFFEIRSVSDKETEITVYDFDKEGNPKEKPFYSRKFFTNETREIRVYGLTGNDKYTIQSLPGNKLKIRVIGGPGKDIYAASPGTNHVHIYDNKENDFSNLTSGKKHLSQNPFVHLYNYNAFKYDKKGFGPVLSYSSNDRIHFGIKYSVQKQQWRKYPFGQQQEIAARYSVNQAALGFGYSGIFTKVAGNWDLRLQADYDFIRWNNYFGVGNETRELTTDNNYNRVRSKQLYAGAGLERRFAGNHLTAFTVYYETIEILNDPGRFLAEETPKFQDFGTKNFGGAKLGYEYDRLDDHAVPTRGLKFSAGISFTQNLALSDSNVTHYTTALNFYIPLSPSFVFAFKTGAATLTGRPEFYQLNKLGGGRTMRGFRKNRFHGETMFYTQTELQFIPAVKTFLFNGRAGLIGFFDSGRVWQPGESSDTWHYGYGGGIMVAPFNRVSLAMFYGVSRDENAFSIRFLKGL